MFHDFQNQSSGLNDTGRDTGFAFNSSFLVCSLRHCLVFFFLLIAFDSSAFFVSDVQACVFCGLCSPCAVSLLEDAAS